MKLTDEQRSTIAAIWINVAYAAQPSRAMQDAAERTLLAGYRLGFEAAREAAAKACEAADEHAYPWACAAMIRSIPLPGGEK